MRHLRTAWRLLCLQGCWSYERMQGIGIGFASLPLLAPLEEDPERYQRAVGRSGAFFNANPYLAGLVVAAAARAELAGAAGNDIGRLKRGLAGPLGAIGDQLFWAGLVPLVSAALLVWLTAGGLDAGPGAMRKVIVAVGGFVLIRIGLVAWGLRLGWRHGLASGGALAASRLPRVASRLGPVAAVVGGFALPVVVGGVGGLGAWPGVVLVAAAAGLAALVQWRRWRVSPLGLTVAAALLVAGWRWGWA